MTPTIVSRRVKITRMQLQNSTSGVFFVSELMNFSILDNDEEWRKNESEEESGSLMS